MPDRVALELWIPTFYYPPLEDVSYESEKPFPTAEERGKAVLEYIAEKCPVRFDGAVIEPELESVEFSKVEQGLHLGLLTDFVNARMRFNYRFDEQPGQISFVWGIWVPEPEFGWDAIWDGQGDPQELQLVFVHGRTPVPVFFSPKEPEFIWHAPLDGEGLFAPPVEVDAPVAKVPVVSIGLVALTGIFLGFTRKVSDFTAVRVVASGALLAGAVFFSSAGVTLGGKGGDLSRKAAEEAFVRALEKGFLDPGAGGVAAPLRPRMVEEVAHSMIMHDQGGALATPVKVAIESVRLSERTGERGFDVDARWRVMGSADHWEHSHAFAKEFKGRFLFAPVDGQWVITAVHVKGEQRLDPETLEPVIPQVGMDPALNS